MVVLVLQLENTCYSLPLLYFGHKDSWAIITITNPFYFALLLYEWYCRMVDSDIVLPAFVDFLKKLSIERIFLELCLNFIRSSLVLACWAQISAYVLLLSSLRDFPKLHRKSLSSCSLDTWDILLDHDHELGILNPHVIEKKIGLRFREWRETMTQRCMIWQPLYQ